MGEINLLPQKSVAIFFIICTLTQKCCWMSHLSPYCCRSPQSPGLFQMLCCTLLLWLYVCSVEHLPQLQKPNNQQTKERGISFLGTLLAPLCQPEEDDKRIQYLYLPSQKRIPPSIFTGIWRILKRKGRYHVPLLSVEAVATRYCKSFV